ncbi:MAG: hypothetical protein H7287_13710 [Thermoleophilia bacterium]|nr:hypothetical protein [Thermoleophilia bacterium]
MTSISPTAQTLRAAVTAFVHDAGTVATHTDLPVVLRDLAAPGGVAARAVEALGSAPLQPTGALRDALDAGQIVATRDVAASQHALLNGTILESTKHAVGEGMNGMLYRYGIAAEPVTDLQAVLKSHGQGGAIDHFGPQVGRALGLDDLLPGTTLDAAGARIEFRPGGGPGHVARDANYLDTALTIRHLAAPGNHLNPLEAATAGRIERQLLGSLDYLLANPDRNPSNLIVDQLLPDASGAVTAIDFGLSGRGVLGVHGGTTLRPALDSYQAAAGATHVDLDPEVVSLIRRRLTPARIDALHAELVAGPGGRGTLVSSDAFRLGMHERLAQLLTGRYEFHPYVPGGFAGSVRTAPVEREATHGFAAARQAARDGYGF